MPKFQVFKVKRKTAIYLTLAGVLIFVAMGVVCIRMWLGLSTFFLTAPVVAIQGLLVAIYGYLTLKSRKYFVAWDEQQLSYRLPGTGPIKRIPIKEIENVDVKLFQIDFRYRGTADSLPLDNLEYEDIKRFKTFSQQLNHQLSSST